MHSISHPVILVPNCIPWWKGAPKAQERVLFGSSVPPWMSYTKIPSFLPFSDIWFACNTTTMRQQISSAPKSTASGSTMASIASALSQFWMSLSPKAEFSACLALPWCLLPPAGIQYPPFYLLCQQRVEFLLQIGPLLDTKLIKKHAEGLAQECVGGNGETPVEMRVQWERDGVKEPHEPSPRRGWRGRTQGRRVQESKLRAKWICN